MSRRSLTIIGIALAIIILSGGVIWYLYSGGGRSFFGRYRVPTPITPERVAGLESERGPLIAITSGAAYFPVITQGGEVRYLAEDGSLWKTGLHARSEVRLLLGVPQGIQKLVWAPSGERAVLWSEAGGQRKVYAVEIAGGKARELFPDISEVAFSPDGKSLISIGHDETQTLVQRFNSDGSRPQTLLAIPRMDLGLRWLTAQQVILWERPSENSTSALFLFDVRRRTLTLLKQERLASSPIFSPRGDKILLSLIDDAGQLEELLLLNPAGKEIGRVATPTLASKCAFSQDTRALLCAIPDFLPPRERLWESEWRSEGSDQLLQFDLENKLEPLGISQGPALNVSQPLLSPDGRYLIFTDPKDGRLYSLILPAN